MQPPQYWFPAKQDGLGWGLPLTWQGWAVVVAFFALFAAGRFMLPPTQYRWQYYAYVAVLVAALLGIAYVKGEPLGR
jgi:hypothetical protein